MRHCYLIFLILLINLNAFCDERNPKYTEKYYKDLGVTELVLENGLQIYLKPNNIGDNEIILQLAAIGGYTSFPPEEQPSARLAADVVFESGIGTLTPDQLSALLYDYSIEFDFVIKPLYRNIYVEVTSDSLPVLLKLISDFIMMPKFQNSGLKEVITAYRESLSTPDHNLRYENAFFELNTQLGPKNLVFPASDLNNVTIDKAKQAFEILYSNPQDFFCIIVGDFQVDSIKPVLQRFLGKLPSKKESLPLVIQSTGTFPVKPVSKVIPLKNGPDSLTRLTFPISIPINSSNFFTLDLVCQTIEAHLRNVMQRRLKSSYGVDVSYEFPFYPSLLSPWISIQYRSDLNQAEDLAKIFIAELQYLQANGPSRQDLESALLNEKSNDDFWQHEDEFWLSFLTNTSLMHLNPEIIFNSRKVEGVTLEEMQKNITAFIDATRYTRLTTKPE